MSWGVIAKIGFLTLQTTRLDEAVETARDILGLRETFRIGNAVYLAADELHHEMVYIAGDRDAVDHISLEARDSEAIAEVRRRVMDAGYPVLSDLPLGAGIGEAMSFVGPDGFVFEIYAGLQKVSYGRPHHGPDRYGHINLHPTDLMRMRDFLVKVLDFRVSDKIGDDAFFLRCNSDHHGIALIKGRGSLHHHAWRTQSIADLGRLGDRLDRVGKRLLWGPVRHGAGGNIAVYFEEPTGAVVELYCDLEQIYDDARPAVEWASGDMRWFNRWSDFRPEDFRRFGIMPSQKPAEH